MLHRTLGAACVAVVLALPPVPAHALSIDVAHAWCDDPSDSHLTVDSQIAACTLVIDKGGRGNADLAQLYVDRGLAYVSKRDAQSALTDFDAALALVPGYAYALTARGAAYAAQRQYKRAIADFEAYLKSRPDDAGAYAAKASAEQAMGMAKAATLDLRKACTLDSAYCN